LGRPARLSRHPQPLVKVRRSREGLKPNSASCSRLQAAGNGDGKAIVNPAHYKQFHRLQRTLERMHALTMRTILRQVPGVKKRK
ncbi:MAG: hypothetical protein ACLQM8_06850, partial [Limisphaerales bacterium]